MATKTTTKAKTKTTKTATKQKSPKTRSAAAKTTKSTKSTTAKVVKPTAVKSKKVKANLTVSTLRKLHLVKALVTTALAIVAGFVMTNATYALTVGYEAKDELISLTNAKTSFVHASQSIMDIQVRWLLIVILGLSAVFSLLAATRLRSKYEAGVSSQVSTFRWVAMGITSALMAEVVALLSGVSDIFVLKLIAGLVVTTCALGWVVEKRLKQAGRPIWSEYVISLFTGLLPWVLIASYAVATWVYGLIRYPWFVYAAMATVLIGFILFAVNQYKHIVGWKNYLVIERNFIVVGTLTQVIFAAILIVGFHN